MKKFFGNRWTKRALLFSLVVSMLVCTAFAAETGDPTQIDVTAINDAFTKGFNSMVINSIGMISAMTPIALTLAGTIFLVRKAMGWFKGMAK